MKRLTGLTFLIVLALFNSCGSSEDGPPGPKTIFKFTFDTSYKTSTTDNWVIVYDKTGKVLFFKAFESGETVTFESADEIPNDIISVTTLTYVPGTTQQFNLENYLDVPVGSEWTGFSLAYPEIPSSSGSFKAKVINVPYFFGASTSDRYGLTSGPSEMVLNAVTFEAPIHNGEKQLMYFNDGSQGPIYRWLENPKGGDSYNFDYGYDFKAFDKTLTVNFPGRKMLIAAITGYEATPDYSKGYTTNFIANLPPVNDSQIKFGFLNQFPNYDVYVSYGDFEFTSFGAMPSRIDYVDPSKFTITNKTIAGFTFTSSAEYTARYTKFALQQSGLSIGIGFNAPKATTSTQPTALPVEIETKYPLLKFTNLEHAYTKFDIQGESYSEKVTRAHTKPGGLFSVNQTATVTVWD